MSPNVWQSINIIFWNNARMEEFLRFQELQLLIREAKYLDQLGGFELPHTVACRDRSA